MIEVDPALKRELYIALAMSGSTLKDWFVRSAAAYCDSEAQGSLFPDESQLSRRSHGGNQEGAFDVASKNQKKSSD